TLSSINPCIIYAKSNTCKRCGLLRRSEQSQPAASYLVPGAESWRLSSLYRSWLSTSNALRTQGTPCLQRVIVSGCQGFLLGWLGNFKLLVYSANRGPLAYPG
ncbi:hypothetical protein VaNZ11_011475, partial [Volvox africanus]